MSLFQLEEPLEQDVVTQLLAELEFRASRVEGHQQARIDQVVRKILGADEPSQQAPDTSAESVEATAVQRRPAIEPSKSMSGVREKSKRTRGAASSIQRGRQTVWVPPGESVMVQGRRLPDGMVYVGSSLRGVSQYVETEPALINPLLLVDDRFPDIDGHYMSYWPSYADITPASRAAYLDWLADGRPGGAYIGYVFLFFYGIERRLLFDKSRDDVPISETNALASEIERLLNLYGESGSFVRYAVQLLSFARCLEVDLDARSLEPPLDRRGWDLSLELKLGLGSIVAAEEPLPALWALSWMRLDPNATLRTAAVRCAEEFNELFQVRYQEIHGTGMKIQRNKTPLTHYYQPASKSFRSQVTINADEIPDVSRLIRPRLQLRAIAESVTNELDPYSRWVGKHGDRESLGAIALLPKELARARQSEELRTFNRRIESALTGTNAATIPVSQLIDGFPAKKANAFSTKEASTFAQLLERLGFGVAPDIRYSNVNLTKHQHAAVFRLDTDETEPSHQYQAATVLLQLGAAVSAADGTISADEERLLESHLEESLHLSETDRTRLRAYLQWLLVEPPSLTRMKSRMQGLSDSERRRIARFAITIAGTDGVVSSDEVKVLNRVYNLLGLDANQLHRDLHELASAPPTQPVTVMQPDEPSGHRIPPPPWRGRSQDFVELDHEKIVAIMKDTREVADLLTSIFEGPTEPESAEEDLVSAEVEEQSSTAADVAGRLLDPTHTELVRFLASRPNWPRSEFEEATSQLGLMPAGAMETINDAAFEQCDEPLIEGDDPLEMNEYALKELLNA